MNDHDPKRPSGAPLARKVPLPSPPRQTIEPPTEAVRPHGVHSVATVAELPRSWAWIATALLVAVAGLGLYLVRGALVPALDRLLTLPRFGDTAAETAPVDEPEPAPEPVAEEPSEPAWDYPRIEEALEPLTQATEQLIAEGRDELATNFRDLNSPDENRALLIGNRWRIWGPSWKNRVATLTDDAPPLDTCRVHAALEPACQALHRALDLLAQIPAAGSFADAQALFDQAAAVLAELRLWQQESSEPTPTEEELPADDVVPQ